MGEHVINILLVDDNVTYAQDLAQDLENRFAGKIHVIPIPTADGAIRIFRREHFDIVLLDYFLDKNKTAEEIITIFRDSGAYIIAISAEARGEHGAQMIKSGADDFWGKDEGFEKLAAKIEKLLKELSIDSKVVEISRNPFFSTFSTQNNVLILNIGNVLKALESMNSLSVMVLGDVGTGKSYFIGRIRQHIRDFLKIPFRYLAIKRDSRPEEIEKTLQNARKLLDEEQNMFLWMDGIFDDKTALKENFRSLVEILEKIQLSTISSTARYYLFAEVHNRDKNTTEWLPEELRYRFDRVLILPSLNDRWEDIIPLANHFLRYYQGDKKIRFAKGSARLLLLHFKWQANLIQLRNVIRNLPPIPDGGEVTEAMLKSVIRSITSGPQTDFISIPDMDNMRKEYVWKALVAAECNKSIAARLLGVTRPTIDNWIKKFGIDVKICREKV